MIRRGEAHYAWKGDAARPETKRARCQKMYALGDCETCGRPATDRHHRDGDTGNNVPENIGLLCRRCHMVEDGRLDRFKAIAAENAKRNVKPPRACTNCQAMVTRTWRGICHACNEYQRRRGVPRPAGDLTPRGELNHTAKLTEGDVREIRRARAAGQSCAEIARRYAVNRQAIHWVVTRVTWAHVPEEEDPCR